MDGTMDLFLSTPQLAFEKVAATPVDEDTSNWPGAILKELFRQVPEASEYTPRVMMIRTDDKQGSGLGAVIITSTTDNAMASSEQETGGTTRRKVLIPVIIKGYELCPLDVLITADKKMLPLNGHRLREALFRPNTFEMITQDWGDMSLYDLFHPPGRSENDYGAGMSVNGGGGGNTSHVYGPGMKYSMLQHIGPSISNEDIEKLAELIRSEPAVQAAIRENEAFGQALKKLAQYGSENQALDLYKAAEDLAPKDVAQFSYDPGVGGYTVKSASRKYYIDPVTLVYDRRAFLDEFGEKLAFKVDTEGTVTVAVPGEKTAEDEVGDETPWSLIEHTGIYRVKTVEGDELTGWAFTGLHDFEGNRIPMVVFTDGSRAAVQDAVAGAPVQLESDGFEGSEPEGTGIFFMPAGSSMEATVPVTIMATEAGMDGTEVYHARTLLGEDVTIKLVPGLHKVVPGNPAMLPDTAQFLPLEDERQVTLISTPDLLHKTAADYRVPYVAVHSDGLDFTVEFHRLPKLASMRPKTASREETLFTLALAGLAPDVAEGVLNRCHSGSVKISHAVDVRPAKEVVSASFEKAAKVTKVARDLRRNLVKEAAAIPDAHTLDGILSLGFINPENLKVYVEFLPYLEKSLHRMCELVLASRLGLNEIPEFAAARASRAMDEVIQGLKSLALREPEDSPVA